MHNTSSIPPPQYQNTSILQNSTGLVHPLSLEDTCAPITFHPFV